MPARAKKPTVSLQIHRFCMASAGHGYNVMSIILALMIMAISLGFFFYRNPNGESKDGKKRFKTAEFLIAILFPTFYILYAILEDESKGECKTEGYENTKPPKKNVSVAVGVGIGALYLFSVGLWIYRTRTDRFATGKYEIPNWRELLLAILLPPVYLFLGLAVDPKNEGF